MKHFSQKWYLPARSPNFGELHRSPTAQPITEKARRGSHQSRHDRVGASTQAHRRQDERRAGRAGVVVRTANHDSGWKEKGEG